MAPIIVFESMAKRSQQITFLNSIENIDQLLLNSIHVKANTKPEKVKSIVWMVIWLLKVTALLLILLTFIFIYYSKSQTDPVASMFFFFATMPVAVSSIRYYQVIFYINLIGHRFQLINEYLLKVLSPIKDAESKEDDINFKMDIITSNPLPPPEFFKEIVLIRVIFFQLWQTTTIINKLFRWSLLLAIGNSFGIIVINFYRLLVYVLKPNFAIEEVVIPFLWAIYNTLYFVILSNSCHNVLEKVKKINDYNRLFFSVH